MNSSALIANWYMVQEALEMSASVGQKLALGHLQQAYRDHLQSQAVAKPAYREHNRVMILASEQAAQERTVDLKLIHR